MVRTIEDREVKAIFYPTQYRDKTASNKRRGFFLNLFLGMIFQEIFQGIDAVDFLDGAHGDTIQPMIQ
jgi:hypothetical protein